MGRLLADWFVGRRRNDLRATVAKRAIVTLGLHRGDGASFARSRQLHRAVVVTAIAAPSALLKAARTVDLAHPRTLFGGHISMPSRLRLDARGDDQSVAR